ncbi:hypothetical protein [Couchioplanes caeruleus]|uniref:Uncharacterized protein n=2 Tax=Couchioplanes caeruleus TaxID=56438 RepID=A0A1K0GJN6_9ACTN|nr:hypothetical protein [Couchioplanes caeruleus]OJF11172.1 hypothetical protein BG844_28095 [Couchioplanes caeruleus subsp. caeruleus]ROP30886.1 hypothetical protein EDD30_3761 [Couchioplanes caeruleus]
MTLPLASTITARFPLVARNRPPAIPLDVRVARLVEMAESAHRNRDFNKASVAFNGAALVASDCGDPELARTWCHRHVNLYLSQAPLNGSNVRIALETVVNLARLRIRAGDGDDAYSLLTDLYQVVHGHAPAVIDGLELRPEQLPTDPLARDQTISWLRDIMLADGTRALTVAGRWDDALAHVRRCDGIGPTLHEGRQVAVIALTMQGDRAAAAALLRETTIKQPWELVVRDLLQNWHAQTTGVDRPTDQAELLGRSLEIPSAPGLSVFRTRLCLAAIDLATEVPPAVVENTISRLVTDVLRGEDANAALDLHQHRAVGPEHHGKLMRLINASGLGIGRIPEMARDSLSSALDLAAMAIRVMPSER